jgi:hypothetical protein
MMPELGGLDIDLDQREWWIVSARAAWGFKQSDAPNLARQGVWLGFPKTGRDRPSSVQL